jgi:hypothetical protein
MSTDYRPKRLITAANLFGGRLEKHGVREMIVKEQDVHEWAAGMGFKLPEGASGKIPGTTDALRCLTDGTNYMWVEISKRGFVASISRFGDNNPNNILNAVAEEFDTDLVSDHDPEFWEQYEGEVIVIPFSEFEVIKGGSDA